MMQSLTERKKENVPRPGKRLAPTESHQGEINQVLKLGGKLEESGYAKEFKRHDVQQHVTPRAKNARNESTVVFGVQDDSDRFKTHQVDPFSQSQLNNASRVQERRDNKSSFQTSKVFSGESEPFPSDQRRNRSNTEPVSKPITSRQQQKTNQPADYNIITNQDQQTTHAPAHTAFHRKTVDRHEPQTVAGIKQGRQDRGFNILTNQ
jgi:hypothetical protein